MKKYIISIDQGTASSRIVLYDLKFNVIDNIQKEFKQYFPKNGWVEHDPLEIWLDIKQLIKNIIKRFSKHATTTCNINFLHIKNQRF